MNASALSQLRATLQSDRPALGLWITLESPSISEMAVAAGFDWVTIDAEHGHLDWGDITAHLRSLARSQTVGLVRIAELNGGLIKRALDCGADGVIVPWIETPAQLREAVSWARYPPAGRRGIGAERATAWGQAFAGHVAESESILVIPMIESVLAADNLEALLDVPGPEVFFFGPADFSSTAGFPGEWEAPGVAERIKASCKAIRRRRKFCGVMARDRADLTARIRQGFGMVGVASDAGLLTRGMRALLPKSEPPFRRDCGTRFEPQERLPQGSPWELLEPVIQPFHELDARALEPLRLLAGGESQSIAPGVAFQPLDASEAKYAGHIVGWATFAPGALLPGHTHPFDEAILLAEGVVEVQVEDRLYNLAPLDQIVSPAAVRHAVRNPSPAESARLLVAMATEKLSRKLVAMPDVRTAMHLLDHGWTGPEWVIRHSQLREMSGGDGASVWRFVGSRDAAGMARSWTSFLALPPRARAGQFSKSACLLAILKGTVGSLEMNRIVEFSSSCVIGCPDNELVTIVNTGNDWAVVASCSFATKP